MGPPRRRTASSGRFAAVPRTLCMDRMAPVERGRGRLHPQQPRLGIEVLLCAPAHRRAMAFGASCEHDRRQEPRLKLAFTFASAPGFMSAESTSVWLK